MSPRDRGTTGAVLLDPRDTRKTSATFFAEMPWDGTDIAHAHEWTSSHFFELFLGDDSALDK